MRRARALGLAQLALVLADRVGILNITSALPYWPVKSAAGGHALE